MVKALLSGIGRGRARRAAGKPGPTNAPTRGRLVAAVNGSGIGLNVVAGDQYVADVLPAQDVHWRVRAPWIAVAVALTCRGGLGGPSPPCWCLEHVRGVHVGCAGCVDGVVPALLLLQLRQPDPGCRLWLHRLQGRSARGRVTGAPASRPTRDPIRSLCAWVRTYAGGVASRSHPPLLQS
jgi:hypothetical protein